MLVVGGAGNIGNLAINGNYGRGLGGAMVIDVFDNGFTANSLGLVTAKFQPFSFAGVSGGFSRVIDAAGNILLLDFSAGEFTVLGSSPKVPDSVIDDLIRFAGEGEEVADEIADNRSESEAAIEAMLDEQQDGGELVCR